MSNFGSNILSYGLIFLFLGTPIILTGLNIYFLFRKKTKNKKTSNKKIAVSDAFTFILGVLFTWLLFCIFEFSEWNEQIYVGQKLSPIMQSSYTPIAFKHMLTFLTFFTISLISYFVLRIKKDKLPPLIACFSVAGIWIGFILTIVWVIQLSNTINNLFVIYFLIFPLNYILCSVRLLREFLSTMIESYKNKNYKNKVLNWCNNFIKKSNNFLLASFLLVLPIICFAVIVLLLFGQQPDSIIKAFTETAEWTLSQKIPPPRLEYSGHYLCTVAACGDKKIVKPLRAGIRNGEKIIVNRQLLVANAFEDLIKHKTPRFHKIIRKLYDKFGYPISKHINTKKRSNFIYLLMKPLELLFLVVLYSYDIKPENRIAIQYTQLKPQQNFVKI